MSHSTRARATGEAGESLAELIVAITIIGLAVTVLVAALATSISASAGHRQHASADTIARSVAEALKDRTVPLDPSGAYSYGTYTSALNNNDKTAFNINVTAKCLNSANASDSSLDASKFGTCSASTTGVQLITVTATATAGKGESDTVTILKRRT
jgi:hypothetical protein